MRYNIQKDWAGATVVILGGGPSLPESLEIPPEHKVIAVNEAGLTRYTEADVLFFGDFRWYGWNRQRMKFFMGKEIISRGYDYMYPDHIKVARWDNTQPIHTGSNALGGVCSGGSAIDLAYKRGASKIVLLGFDMNDEGPANFHNMHKEQPVAASRAETYIPSINAAATILKDAGVEVLNATKESKLNCFEFVDWGDLWPQAQ
jgi:hypothetical protein